MENVTTHDYFDYIVLLISWFTCNLQYHLPNWEIG